MDTYLLISLLLGTAVSLSIQEKEVKSVILHKSCFLDEITFLDPSYCTEREGDAVKHLGSCRVARYGGGSSDIDGFEVTICKNGRWSSETRRSVVRQNRRKRFFGAITGWIIGGCILFCGRGGGGGGTRTVIKYPPSFPDPCKPEDVLENYNVGAGKTSVVVTWTIPKATDRDGDTPSVTQVGGGLNGGRFEGATYGKTHYITYKATDDDGLTGHCHFQFTVTTLTCVTLPWPTNGARSCVNNNILGSSCQYTCDFGYQLVGSGTVTCQNELAPTWSPVPSCEKKTCSPPSYPDHSTIQCTQSTYVFQSVCAIFCVNGFSLEGPFFMQCQADGTWPNTGSSSCKDNTPPNIACSTPQIFYADRGTTTTSVYWQVPTATDKTDFNPAIIQTDGPTIGAVLEVGRDFVTYKAVDDDGNESQECFIELRVEEITCGHPLDSFADNYLIFECSPPRYVYGTSCTLSCTAHLPLEGTDLVTCEVNGQSEGVWSWGTGEKPYCREVACPDLDPPINGALVYDTIQTRPMYTMMCNDKFDIPDMNSSFNGMFFCTDNGDWKPLTKVPDCIEYTREHKIHKRQSETHLLIFEFDIVMVLKLNNTSLRDAILLYDDVQLNILKPAVQEMINNGTFDVQGFVLKPDSFQTASYGEITCDPGYMLDSTACKPCPVGYLMSQTTSKCDPCPIGQYKDNESDIFCVSSPAGYSTMTTGAKSLAYCNKLCGPGSYSPNTMESCSSCHRGYYQDEYGQTSCKPCPSGTTTESTNSTSVNDCKNYDVFLETTSGGVTVSTIPETLSDITFMFWSKRFNEQNSNAVLSLTNGATIVIKVYLTESVRVEIPSQMDEIVGSHNSFSWNHMAVTWDTTNANVTVYLGGESIYTTDAVSAPSAPLLENGTFVVTSSGQTGVYLTGLHLLGNVLNETDIANHATSCHITENEDVINMGTFANFEDPGISFVVASSCDAYDECLSSPCNGHICTNGQNGFTCICKGGWTGATCAKRPDLCIGNGCKNNATCFNEDTNYTCTCLPGYSGTFCEVPPVDGGWSEWKLSECSKSCGSGTRNRTRQCDSPLPDAYGADCIGDEMETIPCNTEDCPVCQEFETKFGTLLNCTTDLKTGSETCVLYCEKDKFLPPGLLEFQTYTCGPGTNYVWDSLDNSPSCVDPVGPDNVNITVNLDYTSVIPNSVIPSFEDIIGAQVSVVPCYNSVHCEASVEIKQSTISLTFNIPLPLGPDIQYDVYISSGGVANDALQELIDAITYLESTAEYITNNTSLLFDVNVSDMTYTADVNSLTFGAGVTCKSGFVALDGICVACPSGTYSDNGVCNFCEKGTYQANKGHTFCLSCADGLTTSTIGSSDISQCTETIESSTTQKPPYKYDDGNKNTVYLAVAASIVAVTIALVALAIVSFKKIRSKPGRDGTAPNRNSKVSTIDCQTTVPKTRGSIISTTNSSEASDSCQTSSYEVRWWSSSSNGYLTPVALSGSNNPNRPCNPPALPDGHPSCNPKYTETDNTEHEYATIDDDIH